jgi:tetratricopeptide (TPR) repeat protein
VGRNQRYIAKNFESVTMKCLNMFLSRSPTAFVLFLICMFEGNKLHAWQTASQTSSVSSNSHGKTVLCVQRDTILHPETVAVESRAIELKGETLITGIEKQALGGVLAGEYWLVEHPGLSGKRGWVSAGAVAAIPEKVDAEIARAEALRQRRRDAERLAVPGNPVDSMRPEVLDLQSDPALTEAWERLDSAIKENESLPEAERLPEPYLARAAIWNRVQRYDEAIQDYFEAVKYAQLGGRDLQELSGYFDEIQKSFANFREIPAPPSGKETLYSRSATHHLDKGLVAYLDRDFEKALEHFKEAVRLLPDNPCYWYLRAICHRNLGDSARAQHDVLLGALMERQFSPGAKQSVDWSLSRIQGPDRAWLEGFRLGGSRNLKR